MIPWRSWAPSWALLPALAWLGLFFVIPLLLVIAMSFASRGPYGGVRWIFTLENYVELSNPLYLWIVARSVILGLATTGICVLAGFPLAAFIARSPARQQTAWIALVLLPFWTNFLVRTYAWIFILRGNGLIDTVLHRLGLTEQPLGLLYTTGAVLLGLVYGYLPFMVLPIYAVLSRVDPALIEAARDLYASSWSVFWRVVWPLTWPGVVAGSVLVFIPAFGAYVTPDLLGGARSMMIGNLVQHEYLVVRDWPLASALSATLMLLVIVGFALHLRYGGELEPTDERAG